MIVHLPWRSTDFTRAANGFPNHQAIEFTTVSLVLRKALMVVVQAKALAEGDTHESDYVQKVRVASLVVTCVMLLFSFATKALLSLGGRTAGVDVTIVKSSSIASGSILMPGRSTIDSANSGSHAGPFHSPSSSGEFGRTTASPFFEGGDEEARQPQREAGPSSNQHLTHERSPMPAFGNKDRTKRARLKTLALLAFAVMFAALVSKIPNLFEVSFLETKRV